MINEWITLQKCDPALARPSAVHGSSDGAGGLDLLHGGEHGDPEHGDGGDFKHRDELEQLDQGLPNADYLSSSCLSRSYLLFNTGEDKGLAIANSVANASASVSSIRIRVDVFMYLGHSWFHQMFIKQSWKRGRVIQSALTSKELILSLKM